MCKNMTYFCFIHYYLLLYTLLHYYSLIITGDRNKKTILLENNGLFPPEKYWHIQPILNDIPIKSFLQFSTKHLSAG